MGWLVAELINHPEVKQNLITEIDSAIGRDRLPSVEDLQSLPYLDAVIQEILRRRPIVRNSAPVIVDEEIELAGGKYVLPVGTMALMNIWGMHHDPAYWTEPMKFHPQRWIDNPDLKKSSAFHPFRSGQRTCIGRFLALTEMKIVISALFQRFDVQHPEGPGHQYDLTTSDGDGLSKPPATVRVTFIRRP